jgi:MFS family permease
MTVALFVANIFGTAGTSVLVPLWISEVLHSPAGLGLVLGASAAGAVLGSIAFTALGPRLPTWKTFMIGALIGGSPRLFALAFSESLPIVLVASFASGVAISSCAPILGSLLYSRIPKDMQTRVFGLVGGFCVIGFPLGGLLAGVSVALFGLHTTLLVAPFCFLVANFASILLYRGGEPATVQPQPEAVTA